MGLIGALQGKIPLFSRSQGIIRLFGSSGFLRQRFHAPLQLSGGIQFAGHPFRVPFRLGCFQGLKQLLRFLAAFQGCLIIPLLLLPCRARQGKVGFVKVSPGLPRAVVAARNMQSREQGRNFLFMIVGTIT